MIGIIVPDLSDVFFATCAHTIQQIARTHKYMTLVVSSERDMELELQEAELMSNRKVAGLLVATSEQKADKRLSDLYQSGMAIVAFDRPFKSIGADAVLVENRKGAEMAVAHLIQHGHRRIACVGYDASVYTIEERIEGYKSAMSSAGLASNVVPEMSTFEEINRWTTKLAKKHNRPTAIFSLNHRTSVHLVRSLSLAGLNIPNDISLIGFDDFDLAECLSPSLTVVSQSPVEMASRATSLLFDQIHAGQNKGQIPIKMVIPVQLIVRSSCGCS
jgi:LacI family transcriptional regulator